MAKQDQFLVGMALAYIAAVVAAGAWFGFDVRLGLYIGATWPLLAPIVGGGFSYIAVRRMLGQPARPIAAVSNDCLSVGWPRLRQGLPYFLILPIFMSVFSSAKQTIGGFGWDNTFIAIDAALHGRDPWIFFGPLVASPYAIFIVNFFYNLWVPVIWAVTIWQTFSAGPHRAQYLISFLLLWILGGTILAHIFASVGPCFVEAVHDSPHFATLMERLHAANETVPIWAVTTQDYLLSSYHHGTLGFGTGISAMPSMHVSIAVLMALLGWRLSRTAGIAFTAYATFIMIGSVSLGWHYAIDGYAGAALSWAIWRLVGYVLHRVSATGLQPASRTG